MVMPNNDGTARRSRWPRLALALAFLAPLAAGCGGGLTPVSGKVTYQGKPVTGGSLVFSPIATAGEKEPGKSGSADIGSDGSFSVSTNKPGDGLRPGKYRVIFNSPQLPPMELKPGESSATARDTRPPAPYMGLAPTPDEVEIKSGGGPLTIELGPKK